MTKQIKITFSNRDDHSDKMIDTWTLKDTVSSKAFCVEFLHNLANNFEFFTKFVGYRNGYRDVDFLNSLMNKCIKTINKDRRYYIKDWAEGPPTQDFLNIMHHHFEILRGSVWEDSEYYTNSSAPVRSAVCGINHVVHESEALIRSDDGGGAAVLTEFYGSNRTKLPPESVKDFSMEIEFGDLFLHYCQIGKTWFEVFNDEDEEIFEPAIQPLEITSGEFDIFWYDFIDHERFSRELDSFLKGIGQDPKNPELRLGYNCIAKWDNLNGLDKDTVIKEMTERMYISRIQFLEDGKQVAGRDFPLGRELYDEI